MPPLNHRTTLEEAGRVYEIKIQECNNSVGDMPYTRDTELTYTLSAAFTAATEPFSDNPRIRKSDIGFYMLYEDHDEDEEYIRTTIKKRKVYEERR